VIVVDAATVCGDLAGTVTVPAVWRRASKPVTKPQVDELQDRTIHTQSGTDRGTDERRRTLLATVLKVARASCPNRRSPRTRARHPAENAPTAGTSTSGSDGTRTRDLRRDSPGLKPRNPLQIVISIHVWSPPGHRFHFRVRRRVELGNERKHRLEIIPHKSDIEKISRVSQSVLTWWLW
jgi:hypothetical protein